MRGESATKIGDFLSPLANVEKINNLPYRNIHGLFEQKMSWKAHEYYGKALRRNKIYFCKTLCSPLLTTTSHPYASNQKTQG
jgi:hypothetical protein